MTPEQMILHRNTANMIRNSSNSNSSSSLPHFYPNPYSSPFFPTNTSGQGASNSALNPGLLEGANSSGALFNF